MCHSKFQSNVMWNSRSQSVHITYEWISMLAKYQSHWSLWLAICSLDQWSGPIWLCCGPVPLSLWTWKPPWGWLDWTRTFSVHVPPANAAVAAAAEAKLDNKRHSWYVMGLVSQCCRTVPQILALDTVTWSQIACLSGPTAAVKSPEATSVKPISLTILSTDYGKYIPQKRHNNGRIAQINVLIGLPPMFWSFSGCFCLFSKLSQWWMKLTPV